MNGAVRFVLMLAAVIVFVLVVFGAAPIAGASALELVALGLAFFGASFLVP